MALFRFEAKCMHITKTWQFGNQSNSHAGQLHILTDTVQQIVSSKP